MTRKKRTSEEMFPLVEAYLASGKTQKTFCRAEDIPLAVFAYWLSKYRREGDSGGSFVEVTPPGSESRPVLEIMYPGGVRLRFFMDRSHAGSYPER